MQFQAFYAFLAARNINGIVQHRIDRLQSVSDFNFCAAGPFDYSECRADDVRNDAGFLNSFNTRLKSSSSKPCSAKMATVLVCGSFTVFSWLSAGDLNVTLEPSSFQGLYAYTRSDLLGKLPVNPVKHMNDLAADVLAFDLSDFKAERRNDMFFFNGDMLFQNSFACE